MYTHSPLGLSGLSTPLTLLAQVSSGLPIRWKIRAPETSKYMTLTGKEGWGVHCQPTYTHTYTQPYT